VDRLAAGDHASAQLARPQLFEPPFNARELASVKVMIEHADEGLDVAADAAELADRGNLGPLVAGAGLGTEPLQRVAGAGERGGDLLGISGDAQAALVVERTQRAELAVHGLGETEEAFGIA
jgi:hypothetical protein